MAVKICLVYVSVLYKWLYIRGDYILWGWVFVAKLTFVGFGCGHIPVMYRKRDFVLNGGIFLVVFGEMGDSTWITCPVA